MNGLMNSLVERIDLLESQSTSSFSWKPEFESVIADMAAVSASVKAQAAQNGNALFVLLARQQEIVMALVMLLLVSGKER